MGQYDDRIKRREATRKLNEAFDKLGKDHFDKRNAKLAEMESQFQKWFKKGDFTSGTVMMRFIVMQLLSEFKQEDVVLKSLIENLESFRIMTTKEI